MARDTDNVSSEAELRPCTPKTMLNGAHMPTRIWLMTYPHCGEVSWTSAPDDEDQDGIETVEYIRADTLESKADDVDTIADVLARFPCRDSQDPSGELDTLRRREVARAISAAIGRAEGEMS